MAKRGGAVGSVSVLCAVEVYGFPDHKPRRNDVMDMPSLVAPPQYRPVPPLIPTDTCALQNHSHCSRPVGKR